MALDIENIDIIFKLNKSCTQLMIGGVPWRGGRVNDSISMQMFIEALIAHGMVVVGAYAPACDVFFP